MYHVLAVVLQSHGCMTLMSYIHKIQSSLHATYAIMLVIICAKLGNNSSKNLCAEEWTRQDVIYFSSFTAKSWLNDLGDICQGQRSLCATHPLMLVIICARFRKNPHRTVGVTELTGNTGLTDGLTDGRTEWNQYRYRESPLKNLLDKCKIEISRIRKSKVSHCCGLLFTPYDTNNHDHRLGISDTKDHCL